MSSKGEIKSFYRQRKSAKAKPSPSPSSSISKKSSAAATLASNAVQPPSLPYAAASPHLHDGGHDDKEEEVLRQFDMNMAFGPCLGMNRLDRWERASRLGLNPPKEIRGLIEHNSANSRPNSLWDGRI